MSELQQLIGAMQQQQEAMHQQQQAQTAALVQQMQLQQSQFAEAFSALSRGREGSLVDNRGVAKPEVLNSKIAGDVSLFKTWRVKFTNWICAAMPKEASISVCCVL